MAEPIGLRLVDTSAWHVSSHAAVLEAWEEALGANLVAVCAPVELEILFSARSASDYDRLAYNLSLLPRIPCGEAVFTRALEVQRSLAHRGGLHHRSVTIADLVIAAAAELAELPVWHYDSDFDRIASVTKQKTIWIARRGSL
jgi:predicted nucleic acid-binding protein